MPAAKSVPKVETWKNAIAGRIVVQVYDHRGIETEKIIEGGQVFTITPEERKNNMALTSVNKVQCPWRNGQLVPVQLLPGDNSDVASNPNNVTDEELATWLTQDTETFHVTLAGIESLVIVRRLLELADKVDARTSIVRALEDRLKSDRVKMPGFQNYDDVAKSVRASAGGQRVDI